MWWNVICGSDLESLIQRLGLDSMLTIEWLESNYIELHNDKRHSPLSSYKHEPMWSNTGQSQIWESTEQKLLGIIIDKNMIFDKYILILCTGKNM